MQYFAYIILSIVILLLMVLIHEAGHYTAAKILGFTVEEFSVGFGPKIFSKRRKNGELFSLRVLPLGGYCAFYGETGEEDGQEQGDANNIGARQSDAQTPVPGDAQEGAETSEYKDEKRDDDLLSYVMRAELPEDKQAPAVKPVPTDGRGGEAIPFSAQKPWKRIIVLLGGVAFNFLSAIIFSLIYIWAVGIPVPMVNAIHAAPDGGVYCPELRVNDVIIAVDGRKITVMDSFSDIAADVELGKTVTLRVLRDGSEVEISAKKQSITTEIDGEETTYTGFGFSSVGSYTEGGAAHAFTYCVPYTFKLSWLILGSFGGLFTGATPVTSMSGPVGSVNMMAQLTAADWRNVLILLPLLASNLAIFNLLPFPALDGAHVVFTVIEWIRKKPINRKVEGMIHLIGMAVLLLFVVVVDILSFAL